MVGDTWIKRVPLLSDYNLLLKQFLYNAGIEDVSGHSSHSGKATCLGLASRLGAEARAKRGYHNLSREPHLTRAYGEVAGSATPALDRRRDSSGVAGGSER